MNFRNEVVRFTATGGFTGYAPFAPGTFGTLAALPFCLILEHVDYPYDLACVSILLIVATWTAHDLEKALGAKDPGCIVIDEIAGMVVTLLWLPMTLKTAVLGFIVFRLLDIVKPPPIGYCDRKFSGGFGIVLDDVVAGLMGNLVLRVVFAATGVY